MSFLQFLNTPLLWGMLLGAIPIIIHLLFRRRFRRIDWAPMHYLKLSIQRNRRRVRLEQLLLLLLRVFLIVLLFFLVARPVMQAAGLGGWLGGRSRTSQILLIDDSLSMDYRDRGRSAFQRAQELAAEVVRTTGPKDRFTLLTSSRPKEPLLRDVELAGPSEAVQLIQDLKPTGTFASWKTTFEAIDDHIEAATYPIRELTVFTDLRRSGWEEALLELGNRWAGQRVRLRIFDMGSERTDNVALVELRQTDRLALINVAVAWEAVVHNVSSGALTDAEATFTVDGKPNLVRLPVIGPGETAQIPLSATFQEAGPHHVAFALPTDDLPADNQRFAVVNVKENVQILLVDGEPSSDFMGGELDYVAVAMLVGVGEAEAFQVQLLTDAEWSAQASGQADLIVLGNVAALSPEQSAALAKLVAAGTGLIVFPGEQTDPTNYNQWLRADGEPLLPASLESIDETETKGLVLAEVTAGPLDALRQLAPAVLERVRVSKIYRLQLPDPIEEGVRVVARWNNAESSPAVVERTLGQGKVLLWSVGADRDWSDWPASEASFVMAVREAANAVVRADITGQGSTAGEALRFAVPARRKPSDAEATVPENDAPVPLSIQTDAVKPGTAAQEQDRAAVLTLADARRPGLYRFSWQETPGGSKNALFAVNPDERERDLARIAPETVKGMWGSLETDVVSGVVGSGGAVTVRGVEIWRKLAPCMLGLLAIETVFATWAGRQR